MADKTAKYVITAEDRTGPGVTSVKSQLGKLDGLTTKLSASMSSMTSLLAGGAALAGISKIADAFNRTIDAADNLGKLSQKIGVSVEDLAGFQHAAELSGISLEQFTQGTKQLSRYMVESGNKLRAAGITATDTKGALLQLSDAFAKMPDGPKKTAIAMELFGKAGADMIPLLNGGAKAMKASIAEGQKFIPVTTEMAKHAEEFNDTMDRLSKTFKGLAIDAIRPYVGEMETMAKLALGATQSIGGLHDALIKLNTVVGAGPLGIFNAGATATQIAALSGVGGDEAKRLSVGKIGVKVTEKSGDADLDAVVRESTSTKVARVVKEPPGGSIFAAAQQAFLAGESGLKASEIMADLRAQDDALESLRQKYVNLADPLQQYREQLDEINRLRESGALTADQATAAEWRVNESLDAAREKMLELSDATQQQNALTRDLGMTFSSAFEDAIIGGKGLSETLQGLAMDVERIVVRRTITEPLGDAISGMLSGFNLFSVFNAKGGVYDSPSLSAYSGQIVSKPTMFAFASGAGIMGEAGPEAILPLRRAANGKLGVEGGGSSVVVNITNTVTGTRATARERNEGGTRIVDVLIEQFETAIAGNVSSGRGPLAGALSSTYGLNRGAGAY